jgi:hypothetical protein
MQKYWVSNRRSRKVKIFTLSNYSSYLCTAQNKETSETDLMIVSNKIIKQGK